MAETSKYDIFLDELNSLEKQIYIFVQKADELEEKNQGLSNRITLLERENNELKKKLAEIESKLSRTFVGNEELFNESFNFEDKEAIKKKITELIAKINYHLRS
ncbi:hypothetical protein [Stygiobacter electus]|uniref:Uncharacterized protein n=1 Tax=Stygiobacter electus TaxID=3032292 RepID=A0AAE3NZI6_9BACT|nr:hypothetical protein [Stygiobacter electus]MDF1611509.1 hypothetical protein [Stygiobacter electus]